ncbi:hypothetical protein EJB05_32612 [Eragrostis curvula]|uniref:Vesicle transport protein n=1 Tax=Eragrostis curvula TaxID=38414 RepID=A0A5J9UI02_9POAL|nr:hypothetical protein EJB05_32612 [Eragrostis curvula]
MDALTRLHRSLVGGDEDEQPEDSILGDTEELCSLSPLQRVYAFAICLVVGLALMILSLLVFVRPIKFAVLFTFGNIMAVGSTAFVMGPQKQLRMMFDPVRVYASAIYVGCVILALIFALWIHDKLLTLIAIICEICALFWYSLSYIPFARRMVSDLMPFQISNSFSLPGRRLHIHALLARTQHAAPPSSPHHCMGKALSVLRPPQPPREGEREKEMELRKRPRPARVDPDFVSSPPPLLLRKRVRKQAPSKRPRDAAEAAKQQRPRKRSRCEGLGVGSPVTGLHPASCFHQVRSLPPPKSRRRFRSRHPFNWYEPDMWTEIAKHLCGHDLVCLSLTCHWFRHLLVEDSIWRYAFIRDLLLPVDYQPPPRPLHSSWRRLYAAAFDGSHSYCYRQINKHIDGLRIGGLLLDTPSVLLTGKLPLPRCVMTDVQVSIEMMGACVLNNARPGIWIADRHLVRCPRCNINMCPGTVQILDVRHSELFLEDEYWDGTWEYEDLGEHFMDEEAAAACCAVFNRNCLDSSYADFVHNTKVWIRKRNDLRPKSCMTPHAVAINSNLQRNGGLLSKFEAMRDTTRDGQRSYPYNGMVMACSV